MGRETAGGSASVLGFVGGWADFEFGRDFYGFFPLSGFAISPAVGRETKLGIESVGWLDDRIGKASGRDTGGRLIYLVGLIGGFPDATTLW